MVYRNCKQHSGPARGAEALANLSRAASRTPLRALLAAALLLVAGVSLARSPTMKLAPGGGPSGGKGSITVYGYPNGHYLTAAAVVLTFNPDEVSLPADASDFIPGPGWTVFDFNPSYGPNQVAAVLVNFTDGPIEPGTGEQHFGQFTDAPILTVKALQTMKGFSAGRVTLDPHSDLSDDQWEDYFIPAPQTAVFVNGVARFLDDSSYRSMAAGTLGDTRVLAVAAGRKLYVMKADDLSDMPGWKGGKDIRTLITSRPTFGIYKGEPVVAVGAAGELGTYSIRTASSLYVDRPHLDLDVVPLIPTVSNPPAISPDGTSIYWVVQTNTGPVFYSTSQIFSIGGPKATSTAPAIFRDTLLVGTSEGLKTLQIDSLTGRVSPPTTLLPNESFATSPVLDADGNALLATATGRVFSINVVTGKPNGEPVALPASAVPLSDPFFSAAAGQAVFGGHDGRLYYVNTGKAGVLAAGQVVSFSTAPLASAVIVGDSTYAVDANGLFGRVGGGSERVDLGVEVGQAVVATGATPGTDRVFINTIEGAVLGIPVQ